MTIRQKRPFWVYLDFNVLVNLLEGKLMTADIKKTIGLSNVIFPFSLGHIEEIHNIKESKGLPRIIAINNHLSLIDSVSKRQYLEKDDSDLFYKKRSCSAFEIYEKISQPDAPGEMPYEYYANAITEEQKQEIRMALNVDSKTLNNIHHLSIIEHLNARFSRQQDGATFLEIIELAKKHYPPDLKWGMEMNISAVFTILDIAGYWKDSISPTSNIARSWDAYHSGVASYCDVLISQDKRMRLKAQIAYDLFNINTKILSIE